jgi:hypothetical protein
MSAYGRSGPGSLPTEERPIVVRVSSTPVIGRWIP